MTIRKGIGWSLIYLKSCLKTDLNSMCVRCVIGYELRRDKWDKSLIVDIFRTYIEVGRDGIFNRKCMLLVFLESRARYWISEIIADITPRTNSSIILTVQTFFFLS